jgi:hypothetical protein
MNLKIFHSDETNHRKHEKAITKNGLALKNGPAILRDMGSNNNTDYSNNSNTSITSKLKTMNRENLNKLADYLLRGELKAEFDMEYFDETRKNSQTDGQQIRETSDCGSVGCAVGHGPFAGIPKHKSESWTGYEIRVFDTDMDEFEWLFEKTWAAMDNTPEGAGLRIKHLLKHGLPEDWEEQMNGEKPLTYK